MTNDIGAYFLPKMPQSPWYMDPATLAIIGIVVSVVIGLVPIGWSQYVKRRGRHVRVRRIRSRKTPYSKQILELFHEKFPDEFKPEGGLDDEFVREIMDKYMPGVRTARTKNIFLVALLGDAVVGCLYSPYYPSRSSAMVSYFAVKGGVSIDYNTSEHLVKRLKWILLFSRCRTVYFETQKRGLAKLFTKLASEKPIELKIRRFDFPYLAGPVTANGNPASALLFAVSLRGQIQDIISKPRLLEILDFIYYEVYGDIYTLAEHDAFNRHQKKLHDLVKHFENTLPPTIVTYPAEYEKPSEPAPVPRLL